MVRLVLAYGNFGALQLYDKMFPICNAWLRYTAREHEIHDSVRAILAFDWIIYYNVIAKKLDVLPKNGRGTLIVDSQMVLLTKNPRVWSQYTVKL